MKLAYNIIKIISKVFLTDGTKQTNDSGLLEVVAGGYFGNIYVHETGHRYMLWHLHRLHMLKILFLMF